MKLVLTNCKLEFATKHGWSDQKLDYLHKYSHRYYTGGSALSNDLTNPTVTIWEIPNSVSKVKISVPSTGYTIAKDYFLSGDVSSDTQTGINNLIIPMSQSQSEIRTGNQSLSNEEIDIPVGAKYIICTTQESSTTFPSIYPYYK